MMEIRLKSTFLELLFVCLCLLTVLGPANGETVVRVKEGSEAVLHCFIRPERDIRRVVFEWKKDGQKEVFFYERGRHYNNDLPGQDEQFKGRVSHFPDRLQSGDASIVIRDTTLSDSGFYTCEYSPNEETFMAVNIELVVDCNYRDRSEENIGGARPKPHVASLDHKGGKVQLWCEVLGASPKPKVKWLNSSGNILPDEEPQVTERGGSYDIILNTTVTKTDKYRCAVKQEEICHWASSSILVNIPVAASKPSVAILDQTKDWSLLQCEVLGVSPKPKVKWQDSSGNILPAEEPQVTERGGSYDIILNTTVTKTDKYRCVVTQEEINHQTEAETYVHISGFPTGLVVGAVRVTLVVTLIVVGGILVFLVANNCIILKCKKGSQKETKGYEEKNPSELEELNKKPNTSSQTETERDEQGEPGTSDTQEPEPQSV